MFKISLFEQPQGDRPLGRSLAGLSKACTTVDDINPALPTIRKIP